MEVQNSSGQGAASVVPEEIKGWNWGAFFLTWIWAIGNKVWIGFLAVIPVLLLLAAAYLSLMRGFPQETFVFLSLWGILLGTAIVFGIKGNKWAWRQRNWASVGRFRKVQNIWGLIGLIYTLAWILGIWYIIQQIAIGLSMLITAGSG